MNLTMDNTFVEKTDGGYNIWYKENNTYYSIGGFTEYDDYSHIEYNLENTVSYSSGDIIDELESELKPLNKNLITLIIGTNDKLIIEKELDKLF